MGALQDKLSFMREHTVNDLLVFAGSVVDVSQFQDFPPIPGKIVSIAHNQTVGDALNLMAKHHISSLPVFKSGAKDHNVDNCLGFVDVLDIGALVVEFCGSSAEMSNFTDTLADWCQNQFVSTPIDAVTNFSHRDPFVALPHSAPLTEAVHHFAAGIHRLAVVDESKQITNLITQSALAKFCQENWSSFGGLDGMSIKELKIGKDVLNDDDVYAVKANCTVVDALRVMREKKLSGVAMLNENCEVIDTFSASDLKGFSQADFARLLVPLQYWKNSHKVCCATNATKLGEAVAIMTKSHIHRVYVVDDEKRMTGVVSLTDIFKAIDSLQ